MWPILNDPSSSSSNANLILLGSNTNEGKLVTSSVILENTMGIVEDLQDTNHSSNRRHVEYAREVFDRILEVDNQVTNQIVS